MTVQELISALKAFPPDMEVMVNGYEGGYTEPKSIGLVKIIRNYYEESEWYYGPHGEAYEDEGETPDAEVAVINR